MNTPLTKRRLAAIEEALNSRLASEINAEFGGDFELRQEDYEAARRWVQERGRRYEIKSS